MPPSSARRGQPAFSEHQGQLVTSGNKIPLPSTSGKFIYFPLKNMPGQMKLYKLTQKCLLCGHKMTGLQETIF